MSKQELNCQVLVIGSGPGGSVTAMLLAEAGLDVILIEEGNNVPVSQAPAYSDAEMRLKYRHAALTVSMDNPAVSYVEGCCVGGASEINAGLYHRPLAQTIAGWAEEYQVRDLEPATFDAFFEANEKLFLPDTDPAGLKSGSAVIRDGAQRLGWAGSEVPRLWDHAHQKRQSMSETFIPRFVKAGGRLISGRKVKRLSVTSGRGQYAVTGEGNIRFDDLFVCGGAIQTPLLLRKSGIKRNVGDNLRMHPAVRVVAVFDKPVNDPTEGVPTYQVSEFKPEVTLGGSYSGKPHLALWLAGSEDLGKRMGQWQNMAIFYALIMAEARGKVRAMPLTGDPWVSLPMTTGDWKILRQALGQVEALLKAAGAKEVIVQKRIDLSTIHLFCSCPMGEDKSRCAVDSFGRLHGFDNIYLNDASILPSSPGVNPQATIMAMARRNAEHFLKTYAH